MKKLLLITSLLTSSLTFAQGSEDFEGTGVDLLPGWLIANQSTPQPSPDPRNWGVAANDPAANPPQIVTAHGGEQWGTANFQATGDATTADGILCNWLISPPGVAGDLSFWTRSQRSVTDGLTVFPDRMVVRYSPVEPPKGGDINVGDCTNGFGDFTEELIVINPNQVGANFPVGYPVDTWTEFTNITIPEGNGRIAFIHYVTSAGALGDNSNRISLDDVAWTATAAEGEVPIFKNGFE